MFLILSLDSYKIKEGGMRRIKKGINKPVRTLSCMKLMIFDLSGVLFSNEENEFFPQFCKKYGLKLDEVVPYYNKLIEMAERNEVTLEYVWAKVFRRFNLNLDPQATTREVVRLKQANKPMLEVVKELRKKVKTAYLTNYAKEYWELISKVFPFQDYFDGGVVSYQVGSRKPEKGCFEAVLKKFGVGVSECLYIDDSQKNVKAATAFGIKGLVFRSK